jgi:glucose-6-phosphate isomerase
MLYTQLIDHCFTHKAIRASFTKMQERLEKQSGRGTLHQLPIVHRCLHDNNFTALQDIAGTIRKTFSTVVVLGTGGSTLCPQTFSALVDQPTPALYYADYIDPHEMDRLQKILDWPNTCFLAISKSGQTLETLTQTLWAIGNLSQANVPSRDLGKHVVVITDPGTNPLRTIGTDIGATILDHVTDIGGRYAAFTNVGLLPAMILGLNPAAFLEGARNILNSPEAPYIGAALAASFFEHNISTTVFMPYVSRLKPLSALFRQLWAESLGKQGKGGTPLIALGTLDQHSQLQLYLDGPHDKWFTLLTLNTQHQGAILNSHPSCSYLAGHTIGDVQHASQQATLETLIKHQRPTRTLSLYKLNEQTLGALTMHMMLETIFTAQLLKVDPFDQPAVEDGKKKAKTLLASSVAQEH